jgi:hypothetical protein
MQVAAPTAHHKPTSGFYYVPTINDINCILILKYMRIRFSYNFKEIVGSQITEFRPFPYIYTLEKCHLLKLWHVIEAAKKNFPSKKASSLLLQRRFFFKKLKDNILLKAFLQYKE